MQDRCYKLENFPVIASFWCAADPKLVTISLLDRIYSRCFLPSGFCCVCLSKKEFLSPKLCQRTYWQWQNDRTCGLQASFSMVTCQLTTRSLHAWPTYFTWRGLARMCFCFTVIATLVNWTNIRCNRFFFNWIWLLFIKLDPKERFKSICLDTINWRRWRGCDRLKKKKSKINIQNPIIEVSTWKYRNSAIYIKLWAFTVDIGSQDTKGARANGGKKLKSRRLKLKPEH